MDLQLKDKKALVLAASKGIGRGVALALASEGCHVIITSSNSGNLKKAQKEIEQQAQSKVDSYLMDVKSLESVQSVSDQILKEQGKVDILVTNGPGPEIADAANVDDVLLKKAVETNLLSVILLCKKFLPAMVQNRFGRVINLTSTTGKEPDTGMVLSNVTRAGVLAYAKTLSREVAKEGITVNSILTGGVATDRVLELRTARAKKLGVPVEELAANAAKIFPVGFIATPEQFSQIILFLASPLSSYVNGVSLPVDGGYMRGI